MSKQKEWWNSLRLYEKIFYVISMVLLCGMLVVACLIALDYDVDWIAIWLVGLINACIAVIDWRNRPVSAFVKIIFAFIFLVFAIQGTLQRLC